jgi:hypothetical protein
MAFDPKNLSSIGYANAFTLWHYKTTADAMNTVDTAGYFNAARDMIRVGDMIVVEASNGRGHAFINQNDGTTVDLTDLVAANTDSR